MPIYGHTVRGHVISGYGRSCMGWGGGMWGMGGGGVCDRVWCVVKSVCREVRSYSTYAHMLLP